MRKRILGVILTVSMLLALTPTTVMAAKLDGESLQIRETANNSSDMEGLGTEASPYRIKNAEQLRSFADMVNGVGGAPNTKLCAVLTRSIDLSGICSADIGSWTPIGTNANPYTGIFDGGSFAITGLYYHKSNSSYAGLFGYNAGIIKNLGIASADVTAGSYTGSVCGYNNGTITGCYNAASVKGTKYTGGVCGYNEVSGTVSICYNMGTVNGSKYVGGICGYNKNTTSDCYNMGAVNGDNTSIGGICGYNRALVSNCFNSGAVNGGGKKYIGSICGYNHSESSFLNCYYLITGEEKGNYGVGMTQEQFASGEVCWLLNDGRSENVVWRQTCGAGFPAFGGKVVYQVQRQKTGGKADEMIVAYSNEKEKKQAASTDASAEEKDSDNNSDKNTDGHIYQEPEWKWKEYKSAQAVFTCQDCGEQLVLKASISKKTTEATCAKEGETVYTASVDRDGETYKDKKTVKTEKLAHKPLVKELEISPTCTEPGSRACWKCPDCGRYFEDENRKTELSQNKVLIRATGHQYSEPEWNWDIKNNPLVVTAIFTCGQCGEKEPANGKVTFETTASCKTEGKIVYTAVVKFKGETYKKGETVSGQPIPHSYGEPNWSWVSDYSTATATVTCKKCRESVSSQDTNPTSKLITASTCKAAGKKQHTAIVNIDGMEYLDIQTETLDKLPHSYGDPDPADWKWSSDFSKATATFTCTGCGNTVSEKAKVSQTETTGTNCSTPGKITYKATVTFSVNGKEYTDTRDKEIPPKHTLNPVDAKAPTCVEDGYKKHWECIGGCSGLFSDSAGKVPIDKASLIVPATGHNLVHVRDNIYQCTICNGTFTVSPDGTTRMYSVEEDAVPIQNETENDTNDDCSDKEKQDEAEPVDKESLSPSDSEETQEDSEPQDMEEQNPQNEQDEESMPNEQSEDDGQNEDESNMSGIPDMLENAARYGLIYPEGEVEDANPVAVDAWEENAVNLRAESIRAGAAQTVQEQQQQEYPLWVSIAVLAALAGVVLFFILQRKDNR